MQLYTTASSIRLKAIAVCYRSVNGHRQTQHNRFSQLFLNDRSSCPARCVLVMYELTSPELPGRWVSIGYKRATGREGAAPRAVEHCRRSATCRRTSRSPGTAAAQHTMPVSCTVSKAFEQQTPCMALPPDQPESQALADGDAAAACRKASAYTGCALQVFRNGCEALITACCRRHGGICSNYWRSELLYKAAHDAMWHV